MGDTLFDMSSVPVLVNIETVKRTLMGEKVNLNLPVDVLTTLAAILQSYPDLNESVTFGQISAAVTDYRQRLNLPFSFDNEKILKYVKELVSSKLLKFNKSTELYDIVISIDAARCMVPDINSILIE